VLRLRGYGRASCDVDDVPPKALGVTGRGRRASPGQTLPHPFEKLRGYARHPEQPVPI
jgi:hypothetical protein